MNKREGRSFKNSERWKRKFEEERELYREIQEAADDILQSANFNSTKSHIQHGNMTVNDHCIRVAKYSLALSKKFRIPCSRRELIRGALLHDYFLYDWHDPDMISPHKLHGFYHPGKALKNASAEYDLTPREKEIIKKHMWPLTVVPPTCREAWIVTTADKWCSLMETVGVHKGHGKILEKVKYLRLEESEQ
ncbi:MAG: phosphohydrolase [Acetatifactor sp.]|nr:phosphohydrolase [Acetatifactor sp.]